MSGRERLLMWLGMAAAGFLVVFVGYAFVWAPLQEAWTAKADAQTTLDQTQADYNAQVKANLHLVKLNPRLAMAKELSLPRSNPLYKGMDVNPVDRELKHAADLRVGYDQYLSGLLRGAGFRADSIKIKVKAPDTIAVVKTGPATMTKKGDVPPFERFAFSVDAVGPQDAVYRALRDFHSENLLHVVRTFSVSVGKPEGKKEADPNILVLNMTVEALKTVDGGERASMKPVELKKPPAVLAAAKRDYNVLKNHSLFTGMKEPPPVYVKLPDIIKPKPEEKKPKGPSEEERLEVLQFVKVTMLAYNQGKGRWEATLYDQAQGQGDEIKVDMRLYKTFQITDADEQNMLDGKVHYIDAEEMVFEAPGKDGKQKFFRARVGDFLDAVWKAPMSDTEATKLGFKRG